MLLEDLVHNDLDLVDVLVGCVCEGTPERQLSSGERPLPTTMLTSRSLS